MFISIYSNICGVSLNFMMIYSINDYCFTVFISISVLMAFLILYSAFAMYVH